jgi:hypothetical protein
MPEPEPVTITVLSSKRVIIRIPLFCAARPGTPAAGLASWEACRSPTLPPLRARSRRRLGPAHPRSTRGRSLRSAEGIGRDTLPASQRAGRPPALEPARRAGSGDGLPPRPLPALTGGRLNPGLVRDRSHRPRQGEAGREGESAQGPLRRDRRGAAPLRRAVSNARSVTQVEPTRRRRFHCISEVNTSALIDVSDAGSAL